MAADKDFSGAPGFSDLRQGLRLCRGSFLFAGGFSLLVNLLMVTPAIYMLAVYDRVMTSGSESMLLNLSLLVLLLFVITGGLEWIRARTLSATSTRLDKLIGGRVFDSIFEHSVATGGEQSSAQPLHDLLQVRQFLTGPALFAFFDAPWIPIYLVLLYLFHPLFGELAGGAVLVLAALAYWNELTTRQDTELANQEAIEASLFTQRNLRSAEVIEAMGMLPDMRALWEARQERGLHFQSRANAKAGMIGAIVTTFRLVIQSLILGLGAYLAIHNHITAGVVVSGSILLGRALAPLDGMISSWRGFLHAREAYHRLNRLLDAVPNRVSAKDLPRPKGVLTLDDVAFQPECLSAPIIKHVSLEVYPGELVALIGASGAGKTTLLRTMLGINRPTQGTVLLDGTNIAHWNRQALGEHIGYLPQDLELLDGTVSENIARFRTVSPLKMVEATHAVGIHEIILKLPQGYETRLIAGGNMLSAGQLQRVALARAIYDWPQLVLLDEPNSNLDQIGDAALIGLLAELKRLGKTVVVATHRTNLLSYVDRIMMLVNGQVALYGPREQVVRVIAQSQQRLTQGAVNSGMIAKFPAA